MYPRHQIKRAPYVAVAGQLRVKLLVFLKTFHAVQSIEDEMGKIELLRQMVLPAKACFAALTTFALWDSQCCSGNINTAT